MSSAVRRPAMTAPHPFHSSWNCRAASDGWPDPASASAHLCSRSPSSPPRKSLGSAMYPSRDMDMSSTETDITGSPFVWLGPAWLAMDTHGTVLDTVHSLSLSLSVSGFRWVHLLRRGTDHSLRVVCRRGS